MDRTELYNMTDVSPGVSTRTHSCQPAHLQPVSSIGRNSGAGNCRWRRDVIASDCCKSSSFLHLDVSLNVAPSFPLQRNNVINDYWSDHPRKHLPLSTSIGHSCASNGNCCKSNLQINLRFIRLHRLIICVAGITSTYSTLFTDSTTEVDKPLRMSNFGCQKWENSVDLMEV